MLERSLHKKNVVKINYITELFITKIYSNIDKCHTILALLADFEKTGRKTGSNENVCGIWFKIGSVARSHWTQGMWRFIRSREKRGVFHWADRSVSRTRTNYIYIDGIYWYILYAFGELTCQLDERHPRKDLSRLASFR